MKHLVGIEATHRDTSIRRLPGSSWRDHILQLTRTAMTLNYLMDRLGITIQSATLTYLIAIPNLHFSHITQPHHRTPGYLRPTGGDHGRN
jgi:hypothetical protein